MSGWPAANTPGAAFNARNCRSLTGGKSRRSTAPEAGIEFQPIALPELRLEREYTATVVDRLHLRHLAALAVDDASLNVDRFFLRIVGEEVHAIGHALDQFAGLGEELDADRTLMDRDGFDDAVLGIFACCHAEHGVARIDLFRQAKPDAMGSLIIRRRVQVEESLAARLGRDRQGHLAGRTAVGQLDTQIRLDFVSKIVAVAGKIQFLPERRRHVRPHLELAAFLRECVRRAGGDQRVRAPRLKLRQLEFGKRHAVLGGYLLASAVQWLPGCVQNAELDGHFANHL